MLKLIFKIIIRVTILYPILSEAQINPAHNFIGVDITKSEKTDYDASFTLAKALGMSRVGLYQNWTAIETAPQTYNMAIMDIANYYYPAYQMAVDLTITPIHTNNLEVPSDLATTAFDSPVFINRFKRLLDSIKAHTPNLSLSSLVIGSEHDVYLGTNTQRWSQYTTFYNAVASHAKMIWPGLKVATELTFSGITTQNTFAQALNTSSDYIGISYYPLNTDFTVKPVATLSTDFDTLVGLYPSKPLCFYQYGYPSSAECNSSEVQQAQFIAQTFTSWDTYASHIQMIDFTWLHDLDVASVDYYGNYYGITNKAFLEYLRTLGLRSWNNNGTDKVAFTELQCQAKARGYNNLSMNCAGVTGIDESKVDHINIFPSFIEGRVAIELPFELYNAEIRIYNQLGQPVKSLSGFQGNNAQVEISDLVDGIYYLTLQDRQRKMTGKVFVKN